MTFLFRCASFPFRASPLTHRSKTASIMTMVHQPNRDERDLVLSSPAFPAVSRRAMMIRKGLLALLACGALGGTRAAAGDAPKTPAMTEAPLVVTTGYGVSGLVLWLAADSGVTLDKDNNVLSLVDKTGNFTLKQTDPDQAPTFVRNGLNDRPVLRFNGNQSLYSPDNFGTDLNRDMTIIMVSMTTNSSLHRQQFSLYLGHNTTPHANRALANLKGRELFDGQFVACYGEPVVKNTFVMECASINSTLTQATFYRNGAPTAVSNLAEENGHAKFEDLSEGVTMGAATDPVCGWQGDIAEELVYDHQLTPAEMQTIWFYLSNKYGLHPTAQSPAPVTTPAATKP
jgi:hypothetical protein